VDAKVTLRAKSDRAVLDKYRDELADLFIVSAVTVDDGDDAVMSSCTRGRAASAAGSTTRSWRRTRRTCASVAREALRSPSNERRRGGGRCCCAQEVILFSIVTVLSLAADQASKIWARATLPVSPANCDVP